MNEDDLIKDLRQCANIGRASNMRTQLKSIIQDLEEGEYELGEDSESDEANSQE